MSKTFAFQYNMTETHLRSLIQLILNTYFSSSYCINIISQDVGILNLTVPVVYVNSNLNNSDMKNILFETWEMGCTDSLVQVKDPKNIVDIFEEIVHKGNERNGERKIMFMPTEEEDKEDLENIIKEKSLAFVANVLVLSRDKNNNNCRTYNLFTHKFNGISDNDKPILLDVWSCNGFKFENNLFPHDMSDLEGKVVKVAAFTYEPYAILDLNTSKTPEGYDGTEIRIVMEFCRWINCTIELVVDKEHFWGQIYDNRTGDGVLGAVAMDHADLGITALYSWYDAYKFLDLSMPAIRTGITCLVPSPTFVPGWRLAIIPFKGDTWMSVGGTLFGLVLVLWFITKYPLIDAAFISFRFMIMQCSKATMIRSIRVLLIWYVVGGMLLDSFYSSSLASSLTVPRYGASIDTVENLRDSNIEWGATHDAWIFSIESSTEPIMVDLVNKFKILSKEQLRAKAKRGNFGFSIERLPAGHYAVGDYVQEEELPRLQLMQEDIYWEQCLMMARKSSPYTRKYNQLLGRLHSSGLQLAWETQVVQKYLNMHIQIGVRNSHHQHRLSKIEGFAFNKVLGAFILLGLGYIVSVFALICEMFISKLIVI